MGMAKKNQLLKFKCTECNYQASQWLGRCPQCGAWNSLEEVSKEVNSRSSTPLDKLTKITSLNEIDEKSLLRHKSGIGEFDRVLGGGLVPGTLCLVGGEPGVGKSTLLLSLIGEISKNKDISSILYVSGEESIEQVGSRARRLGIASEKIHLINETKLEAIIVCIDTLKPSLVIVDSIQTTYSEDVGAHLGSPTQIKEVTFQLMNLAKKKELSIFVIGHITKDGVVAGPKMLEHMVDVVLYLEGSSHEAKRVLRAQKNRFGDTQEIGLFEMHSSGVIESIQNEVIKKESRSGSALTMITEGSRDFIVEVQALVVEASGLAGRRVCSGYDLNRLNLLLAIIEKNLGKKMMNYDVYLSIVGGFKISHHEADLAVIAAIRSSLTDCACEDLTLYLGEVLLSGEVTQVRELGRKMRRAQILGMKGIVLNANSSELKAFEEREMIQIEIVDNLKKYFQRLDGDVRR